MSSYAREFSAGAFAYGGHSLGQREAQASLACPPDLVRFLARIDAFLCASIVTVAARRRCSGSPAAYAPVHIGGRRARTR